MSIQAVAWALDQDLPARPKLVLVSIANHANHTDGYCWLKAETIAQEAACKPRSVYRFIGDLIRNGYIRKAPRRGEDGRQRANDYWILFGREPAPWVSVGVADEELPEEDGPEVDGEAQDIASPDDSHACGENTTPDDSGVTRQPVETQVLSCGPTDSGVSHKGIAEPSKVNPKIDAPARARPPRHYKPPPPPPPQPVGSVAGSNAEWIFVFDGSKAYKAWQAVKMRERGGRPWAARTMREGRWGWWFPSLFPPGDKPPEGDQTAHLSDEDIKDLAKTG